MKHIATVGTLVILSTASLAVAAEKEESTIPNAIERLYAIGSISHEAPVKRPAILPTLYVTLAAMQAWDVYSTSVAVKAGARESNPVAAPFAGNPGSMVTLKLMSTASTIFFTERMWRTNRVKAIIVMAAINGATAAISMNNMRNARVAAARR
jgi:hypothetical protein